MIKFFIIFILLYSFVPLFFQFVFGFKAIEQPKPKLSLRKVCMFSALLLVVSFGIHFWSATKVRDGLASLAILAFDAFIALFTVLIMIVQMIVKKIKYRK
ncbi:MAG: hypothetical protein LBL04_02885 [Bacteroidales bacterium]|nr:hypothetical protein [Bacteroidales bacterium]